MDTPHPTIQCGPARGRANAVRVVPPPNHPFAAAARRRPRWAPGVRRPPLRPRAAVSGGRPPSHGGPPHAVPHTLPPACVGREDIVLIRHQSPRYLVEWFSVHQIICSGQVQRFVASAGWLGHRSLLFRFWLSIPSSSNCQELGQFPGCLLRWSRETCAPCRWSVGDSSPPVFLCYFQCEQGSHRMEIEWGSCRDRITGHPGM